MTLNREDELQIGTDLGIEQIKDHIMHSKTFLNCLDSREIKMNTADKKMEIIDACFNIAYDEMVALYGEIWTVDFTMPGNSSIYSADI